MKSKDEIQFIIFGGTGDLAQRKLFPAFYNLEIGKQLPENLSIITTGRRFNKESSYLNNMFEAVNKYSRCDIKNSIWQRLADKVSYCNFDLTDDSGYKRLKNNITINEEKIFYLAVAPQFFDPIVKKLNDHQIVKRFSDKAKLVIEKPFGKDLETATRLNKKIRRVFSEDNIFRIDHYLGKEMIQNILFIRFSNVFFESVWNNKYIDNIQIISSEKKGIGQRGAYYEQAGALKDMLQNHMLQLLTLTTMEPPANLKTESIRSEKVKILKNLAEIPRKKIKNYVIRGQYDTGTIDGRKVKSYQEEKNVSPASSTETFIAVKTHINNLRWSGVPIYIKTGKRLSKKYTEIIVEFNSHFHPHYMKKFSKLDSNLLIIKIQPQEGVSIQFNAKKPGTQDKIIPVKMDFCQNCPESNNTPEAYERLIYDIIQGDTTLFTRWDEVKYSWQYIDKIADIWEDKKPNFPNYSAGSKGPKAADDLLKEDNRKWLHVN